MRTYALDINDRGAQVFYSPAGNAERLCYIAGPMRGLPDHNYPAFDAARDMLVADGWSVVNPADVSRVLGYDETAPIDSDGLRLCMRANLSMLTRCDALFLLSDWRMSEGARAERIVAELLDLELAPLACVA